jgi:hypothetical protein
MLRVAALLTPILLITAISCSDSSSSDSSSSTTNNTGGDTAAGGAADNQGGGESTTTAGKTSTGGSANQGGSSATTEGGASSTPSGGAPNESTGGAPVEMTGGASSGGAGGATSAACPNLFGTYSIKTTAGMCGDLNKGAPQAIDGNDVTCAAHFVSNPAKGKAGINGAVSLNAQGNFKGAKLTLGSMNRNDCSGTYNALAQTMTVKCGAAADLCTAVLTKQ